MFGKLGELLVWHYSDTAQRRSPAQEESERKFLGLVPFHRLMLLPAAVIVQMCAGSFYAWSVYNGPIDARMELVQGKAKGDNLGLAANTFYVAVGCFGPSAAAFGPWLEREGPRKALFYGSTLYLMANLLAALACWKGMYWLLYVGYGCFAGLGLGITYITPVSPLQKWFPDYRGVVSGMAVCGFGGGSMIASKVQNLLIETQGVSLCFVILGCVYWVLMVCCTLVLRTPPEDYILTMKAKLGNKFVDEHGHGPARESGSSPAGFKDDDKGGNSAMTATVDIDNNREPEVLHEPEVKMTLIEAMFTWDYRLMYIMLMANAIAGLLTISKLAHICKLQFGKDADLASTVVSVNSGFNLTGRILMGLTSDFFGRKPLFMVSLVFQAVIVLFAPTMIMNQAFWPYCISMWLLSAFYGGGFGLIPAFLADQFGVKNIGALHGIILTAWSFIGVAGGLAFKAIYKAQVSKYGKAALNVYNVNYYWIAAVIFVGVIATPFIHTDVRDALFPRVPGQWFCIRVGKRLLRVSNSQGVEYLDHQTEEREWRAFLLTLPENQSGYTAA